MDIKGIINAWKRVKTSLPLIQFLTSGVYEGLGSLVVTYNINPFITSTSLSPTLTWRVEVTDEWRVEVTDEWRVEVTDEWRWR